MSYRFPSSSVFLFSALATALLACSADRQPLAPIPSAGVPVANAALSAGEHVFVLNRGTGDVSVLSAARGYAEARRIPLPGVSGVQPSGLAVDPAAGVVYVSFADSSSTVVAVGFDGTELGRARMAGYAPELALDPGHGTLAVADGSGITLLDARTLERRGRVETATTGRTGAWHVSFDATGATAVVSHSLADEVALVSMADLRVTARVPVHAYPKGIALLDGIAYVAANDADQLDEVDLGAGTVRTTVGMGNGPSSVVASAVSRRIYVVNALSGQISVVDADGGSEVARWSLHHNIPDVAVSSDGTRLFASDPSSDSVQILDTATGAQTAAAHTGRGPGVIRTVMLP